jgi:RsiW-degrading membrane proteinase PrsW (M82 family)
VLFGAFWLILLSPIRLAPPSRWFLLLAGLLMFAPSIALVQLPLQAWVSRLIVVVVGVAAYQRNITLLAIPAVILSGIIQEGAKLIPIAAYAGWRKQPIPRFGLSIGALVGLGYGVTEAPERHLRRRF